MQKFLSKYFHGLWQPTKILIINVSQIMIMYMYMYYYYLGDDWTACIWADLYLESYLFMRWVITHNFLLSFLNCKGKHLDREPQVLSNIATASVDGRKTNDDVKWEMVGKGQRSFQGDHVTGWAPGNVDSGQLYNRCLHREYKVVLTSNLMQGRPCMYSLSHRTCHHPGSYQDNEADSWNPLTSSTN